MGFWRAGKGVFEAQLEAAEGEAAKCKSAKEWLELAVAGAECDLTVSALRDVRH